MRKAEIETRFTIYARLPPQNHEQKHWLKTSIGLGAITMKIFSERENRNKFSERLIYCDFDFTRIVSLLLAIKVSLINCRFLLRPPLSFRALPLHAFLCLMKTARNLKNLFSFISLTLDFGFFFFMLRFVNKKTSNEKEKDSHPPVDPH